jgi:hypothetical protein
MLVLLAALAALVAAPGTSAAVVNVVERKAREFLGLLILNAILTAFFLGTGFAIACFGGVGISIGRGITLFGAILGVVLWGVAALMFFGYSLGTAAGSSLAKVVSKAFPSFSASEAENVARRFFTIIVWIMILVIWATWVPTHRVPTLTLAVIPVFAALAWMAAANWFPSAHFRPIMALVCIIMVLSVTVALAFPKMAKTAEEAGGKGAEWISQKLGLTVRDKAIHTAETVHEAESAAITAAFIEKKREMQRDLVKKGLNCPSESEDGGPGSLCKEGVGCFCTKEDMDAHGKLDDEISRLSKKPGSSTDSDERLEKLPKVADQAIVRAQAPAPMRSTSMTPPATPSPTPAASTPARPPLNEWSTPTASAPVPTTPPVPSPEEAEIDRLLAKYNKK